MSQRCKDQGSYTANPTTCRRRVEDAAPAAPAPVRNPFQQRTTVTYDLLRGQRIVYRGTTTDLRRWEAEHRSEGLRFDRLRQTSRKLTPQSAGQREEAALATYRRGHGGSVPHYNTEEEERPIASLGSRRPQSLRNMQAYDLRRGDAIVYRGISYDLEAQEKMWRGYGRDFDRLVATSPKTTQPEAERLVQQALAHDRAIHSGKEPLYNKMERDAGLQLARLGGSQSNLPARPRRRRVGSMR